MVHGGCEGPWGVFICLVGGCYQVHRKCAVRCRDSFFLAHSDGEMVVYSDYGIGVNDFEASSLVGYLTVLTSGVPFCAQSDTADGSRPKAKCSYGLWWWCATTCGLKMVLTRFGW